LRARSGGSRSHDLKVNPGLIMSMEARSSSAPAPPSARKVEGKVGRFRHPRGSPARSEAASGDVGGLLGQIPRRPIRASSFVFRQMFFCAEQGDRSGELGKNRASDVLISRRVRAHDSRGALRRHCSMIAINVFSAQILIHRGLNPPEWRADVQFGETGPHVTE